MVFDNLSKATSKAFQSMDSVVGNSPDEDVRLYESLKEDDFIVISQKYGADDTADYIREMETKRMRRGR